MTLGQRLWHAWNRYTPFKIVHVQRDWAGGLHVDSGGLPIEVKNASSLTLRDKTGKITRRELKSK